MDSGLPPCMNCQLPFEQHTRRADGRSSCPRGDKTFDFEFQVNPEVTAFVEENLDRSPEDLVELWTDRVRRRQP